MTISNQDEYDLKNGQIISIQFSVEAKRWEVACWNADGTAHWYKEFENESSARNEYKRWK